MGLKDKDDIIACLGLAQIIKCSEMTSSSSPDSNLLDIWDKLPGLRFSFRGSVDGLLGLCVLLCIRTGANHTRARDRGSAVKIENIWALATKELSVPYKTQILLIPENFKIIDLFADSVPDDKHMKHVKHLKRERVQLCQLYISVLLHAGLV